MQRHDPGFGHRDHSGEVRRHGAPRKPARGRASTIAALGTIALLASWAGIATLYILFRDDALKLIAERQVAITRAYDAQVIELQAEIDRLRSLKLIDQERVDRAVTDLVRRQVALETRQSALSALGASKANARGIAPEITGSVPPTARPSSASDSAPKPSPLSDTIMLAPPSERRARLESRSLPPLGPRLQATRAETATEVRLVNLARELAQLETAQSRALNEIEERYDGREQRMRRVLAELGLKPPSGGARLLAASAGGLGGPFLPWTRPPDDPFARQVHRIRAAAASVEALEQEIAAVPVRPPTADEIEVTSAFGVRLDPFLRQLAQHTGVDLRGEAGDPVQAAAAGKVVQAERNGGYGLMVEIDHGNGLATRYAHMSAIAVREGDQVGPGTVIGRVGSTGRSTGPHLHYEVRQNGEAVDPQKFLRAGLRLETPL